MRTMLIAVAMVATLAFAGNANAGWIAKGTGSTGPGIADANLKYAVYQATSATTVASVALAAGQYAYFYQLVNVTGNGTPIDFVNLGVSLTSVLSADALTDKSLNVAVTPPQIFTNTNVVNGSFNGQTFTPTIPLTSTRSSTVFYLVSNNGPNLGLFTTNTSGGDTGSGSVLTPVPLPATLGLALCGVPFVGLLRRRKKSQ